MRLAFQALIAVLVILGLVEGVVSQLTPNDGGYFGFALGRNDPSGRLVTSVDPGSPAAAAGIRPGDRILILPTRENAIVNYITDPGDTLTLQDGSRTIALRAISSPFSAPVLLVAIIIAMRLAFLAMATLVAWRRPDDPAARALALFSACFGFGTGVDVNLFHPLWSRLLAAMLIQTTFFVGALAALAFACWFPKPQERGFRAAVSWWIWPLAAFGIVVGTSTQLLAFVLPASTQTIRPFLPIPFILSYMTVAILMIAVLWNSYRSSTGSDRVRVRWVLLTFAVGFSGVLVFFAGVIMYGGAGGALQFAAFTTFVIPFGLAYVILRHRVLDIGFVINRAVVYAGVSVVVVATFVIFEWLVSNFVQANSRASVILQLCAALALGLLIRPIHNRVDRWVDDLFFRERHLAEAAVRKFAQEALLVTSESDLIAKTVDVAQRNMRLSGCAFYTARDGSYVPLQSTFVNGAAVS
ncbi:MAG TPA: PDZ domain-containing protein, partial [Candidatus Aquilonibacter sp.]